MTLDSRAHSIEAVTRACYARGLPDDAWLTLVRKAGEAGGMDAEKVEREVTDALLVLLTAGPVPPPLIVSYLYAALHSIAPHPPLCRPGVVAHTAIQHRSRDALPLSASECILDAVSSAHDVAPSQPLYLLPASAEATRPLDVLLPLVVAHPATARSTARWLAGLVESGSGKHPSMYADQLLGALESLEPHASAGPAARELYDALCVAQAKSVPRGRGRRRAAPPPGKNLDAEALQGGGREAAADVVLVVSEFLSDPYRPTAALVDELASLVAYRLAQAPFRGSTTRDALVALLAELLGTAVRLVQGARREDVVLEGWLFAKLPHALNELQSRCGGASLPDALADALRAARDGLAAARPEGAMDVDGTSSQTFDSLVVALCQRELLSPDVGASLAQQVDVSELQPAMVANYSHRLAGAGQNEVKQLLDELLHSFASQQAITKAFADDFASKASSNDLPGLAIACEALLEHKDALAVFLLHLEPRALLSPVREVLDSVDTSQDDFGDGHIERYGSLVLFLQLVASRFKLHSNLAHHLGSTSSFFTRWLPSSSAVYALSTLSDEERGAVSGWIGALFGEGISDDLMHSTNPRTLLRVAPTILKQSLMARQAGVVDLDSLRDALSYFLQELLRFTLPGVLLWLIEDIQRTPASAQQSAMLDILQTLVLSDSLPSSVTELVAPSLATLLLDASLASLPSSTLDRTKLLKLIATFRPLEPALRWAARLPAALGTPTEQLRGDLDALRSASDAPPHLSRSVALARAHAQSPAAFLRGSVLPLLATEEPERTAVALLSSGLLGALVTDVLLLDLARWARLRPTLEVQARGERLADVIAGAAVRDLARERTAWGARRALELLSEGVRHAQAGAARPKIVNGGDAEDDEEELTMLDAFVDRLLSWPAVVEACPALATLGGDT